MPLLTIRIRNAEVSINSSQELTNDILLTVFSCLIKSTNFNSRIHYKICKEGSGYTLFRKNRLTHRNKRLENILLSLEYQIVNDLLKGNRDVFQIHAASVSYNSNGYLFIGEPNSGKTSISILLLKNRWGFLSDEISLLDSENLEIFPFPRNLIIKPHLVKFVNVPDSSIIFSIDNGENDRTPAYFLNPLDLGEVTKKGSIKLKKIFFLSPIDASEKSSDFEIVRIGQIDAFNKFTSNILNFPKQRMEFVDETVNIIRNIPTFHLKICNPFEMSRSMQSDFISEIEKA